MAKPSCDWPKAAPRFLLTPTTRNWMPEMRIVLSSGLVPPNRRSATSQPTMATGRLRSTSVAVIIRPCSAL
ncbi:hypothetical protein D3C83_69240 [compost metagenome]